MGWWALLLSLRKFGVAGRSKFANRLRRSGRGDRRAPAPFLTEPLIY